jgi:NAD(P)-dependent dehydrogenase (short-subunit alcohol dehydrogenase family)
MGNTSPPMNHKSVAVVTGGAGDIGQAIASKLKQTHDIVVLVDIDEEKLSGAHGKLSDENKHGGSFQTCTCDITKDEEVAKIARSISIDGIVRTLVNNAGATRVGSLGEMTPEAWRQETSLNLDASFFCFHAFEESLKATGGSVINIVSANGLSVYGNPAYSAAKAGLVHFTKSIAVEYGKFGIRANCVAPGTVRTGAWVEKAEANPGVFDEAKKWYPLQRGIEPDDIANAVAFLADDKVAGAITGICMPVDCGLTAGQPAVARTFGQSDNY